MAKFWDKKKSYMLQLKNKNFLWAFIALGENPRHKHRILSSLKFLLGYKGMENMFYLLYKIIIFRLNKDKNNKRSANV